jgi:serralysin
VGKIPAFVWFFTVYFFPNHNKLYTDFKSSSKLCNQAFKTYAMYVLTSFSKLTILLGSLLILSSCIRPSDNDKSENQNLKLCTIKGRTLVKEGGPSAFAPDGLAKRLLLWKNRKILNIYFFDGKTDLQNRVIKIASEWEPFSGIQFASTEKVLNSDIRVSFRTDGWWSLIGSEASNYDKTYCTLSLDSIYLYDNATFRHVVLHEFGHALGLLHEHQHPGFEIPWNNKLYEYYKKEYNVDSTWVYENVVRKYSDSQTIYGKVDPKSIMIYAIPEDVTDGFSVEKSTTLSEYDKIFIKNIYKND